MAKVVHPPRALIRLARLRGRVRRIERYERARGRQEGSMGAPRSILWSVRAAVQSTPPTAVARGSRGVRGGELSWAELSRARRGAGRGNRARGAIDGQPWARPRGRIDRTRRGKLAGGDAAWAGGKLLPAGAWQKRARGSEECGRTWHHRQPTLHRSPNPHLSLSPSMATPAL